MKRNVKILFCCFVCLLSFSFCACGGGNQPTYWEQKVAEFGQENCTYERGQIIFVGDSITDDYDLDEFYGSYNLPLKTYNRGIGGDTTSGLLRRMSVSLFDLEPSKIVMLIGINDLNGGKSSEYVLNKYREILSQIKCRLPECEVYIQSVYPVNGDTYNIAGSTGRILEVNTGLPLLANEYGYTYIDVFPQLKTNENLLKSDYAYDGLHPNHAGYEIITACIIGYLQN